MTSSLFRIAALFAVTCITACGQTNPPAAFSRQPFSVVRPAPALTDFRSPALVAVNINSGALEYWPLSRKGGQPPKAFIKSPGLAVNAMAADKGTLFIADARPSQVVLLNVYTAHVDTLPDPFGTATDIAVDKNENIYVANYVSAKSGNIAVYPANSRAHPKKLVCSSIGSVFGVSVDNEGDAIVDGTNAGGGEALYEIANGGGCSLLDVPVLSGVSGMVIDPATDDLLVMDDPSECAGGLEGRVRIFPKPYHHGSHRTIVLGGNCPGGLWLNADSSAILENDSDVSGSFTFIRQFSYPNGYKLGNYAGGNPGAFATVPNSLPN